MVKQLEKCKRIIGYQEASTLVGLPVGTLYSLVCKRLIPHRRIGPRLVRFSIVDLENWLDEKKVHCHDGKDSLKMSNYSRGGRRA